MARKETVAKFKVWIEDDENVDRVLDLISGGMTLQKAAVAVAQPYTCLQAFFTDVPEMRDRYAAARKAWADAVNDESIEIADTVTADPAEVAKAKLRIETRTNQARAYGRERWGEAEAAKVVPVTIQIANLRGGNVAITGPAEALPAPLDGGGGES